MKTGVACWAAGISCLYFSFLHLFGFCTGMDLAFVVTVLFVGLAVYVAGRLPRTGKLLGVLLLVVPIMTAYWLLQEVGSAMLFIAPPILYGGYTIVTGKWDAIYWEMRQLFAISAVVLGVEIFAGLILQKDMTAILTYAIVYLLLAFLALNIFRFGRNIDKKEKAFYALHLGVYLYACGACAAIVAFFSKTGGKILEIILTPFAMLLAALVSLGSGITAFLGNKVEELEPTTEKVQEQVAQNQQAVIEQSISNDASGGMPDGVLSLIVAVVLVLLLIYAVYRAYRFWRGRCVRTEEIPETIGTVESSERKGFAKINLFKTNREKIRKEYAKHMRTVRVKGYRINKSSTSMDICNEAKARLDDGGQNEERIRELYMKARYSGEEITDEDVKEMRQLV